MGDENLAFCLQPRAIVVPGCQMMVGSQLDPAQKRIQVSDTRGGEAKILDSIFLILKSTEALKSLDAHYAPCKFYCMMQYDCLLIVRWRHPRICLARASVFLTFNLPRHDPVRTFEDFFTLTQESRVLNHYPV